MDQMTSFQAIKAFFERSPHGRKVEMAELRALSADERQKLGQACCLALGCQWVETAKTAA